MNEEQTKEINNKENTLSKKDEFDIILDKIKKMSEAVELHTDVKNAVSKNEVDNNYLKYIENSLEDKIFCDAKFDKIHSKVLLEVVCPELEKIENFQIDKLEIENVGSHFEELENYIDKICTYDGNFICMFGINERNPEDVIKYEQRKFTRVDMVEAVKAQYPEGKKIDLYQYDEYYVCIEEGRLKVYTERKVVSLAKIEDTVFDKIKQKLINLFSIKNFSKKKCLPNLNLVYDTNPNRIKDIEVTSKIDAKNRMKTLLTKERKITRDTAI